MNYKKLTAAILCAVMTLSFAVPAKAVTKEEIDEARKKAAETEQALEVTNKKITDLEEDKKELEEYLGVLNSELDDIGVQLNDLGVKIGEKEVQLEITKSALERAKLDEEKQYGDMKARIRFMYEKGNKDLLVALLSSESVTELLNRADQFEKITGYDRKKLEEYKETKEAVEAQESVLLKEQEELLELRSTSEEKHRELESLVSENGIKLDGYLAKIGEEELIASDLKARVEKQKATLNELVQRAEKEKREAEEKARREAELKRLAEQKAAEEAARKEKEKKEETSSGKTEKSSEKKDNNYQEQSSEKQQSSSDNSVNETEKKKDEEEYSEEAEVNTEPEEEKEEEAAPEEKEEEEKESGNNSSGETFLGTFKITAYCNCAKCCGRANQATASGVMPSSGHTVAMGGVPFGTKLRVGGNVYTVEDRGTPYGHVDIFFNSHSEALQFGLRYMDVYQLN